MEKLNGDGLVLSYNKKAMDFLRSENYKNALSCLNKAEEVLGSGQVSNLNKLLGLTLNNFGCFYKRTGNPSLALNFLKKALEIESKDPVDVNNLAGTHLNMCAILSSIGEHKKALDHSLKAMNLLKDKVEDDGNLLTTLIVAHYNAGIEYEMLTKMSEARKVYLDGLRLTVENFGEDHTLAVSLKGSIRNLNLNLRKTISISPIRGTPGNINMPRGSALRSSLNSSGQQIPLKPKAKPENLRFITGERLRPMHKKEDFRARELKTRRKYDVRSLIKEMDGESSKYLKDEKKKLSDDTEDSKNKGTDVSDRVESLKLNEKNSIATQVEFCDRRYFKIMRNNAAVIIQKFVRGYLARKRVENKRYEKQVREAEEQMRKAQERLEGLKAQNKHVKKRSPLEKVQGEPTKDKDFVPVVFKTKLERSVSRESTVNTKRKSLLAPIPEENEYLNAKAVIIQKNFKGWKVRKNYREQKKAVIKIQKHIRRYTVRKLYLEIKEAIVFIQRFWRRLLRKRGDFN